MDIDKINEEISQLKKSLETQIDVVLRLDEEKQMLRQENRLQKDKIRQLNQMLEKYIGFQLMQIEKAVQTDLQGDVHEDSLSSCSGMSLSQSEASCSKSSRIEDITQITEPNEMEVLSEAKNLLNTTKKTSKPTQKMPIQQLRFCGDKENKKQPKQLPPQKDKDPKDHQIECLAQEILRINKENQKLQLNLRNLTENLKKMEKSNLDLQKATDAKNYQLEKLREENAEMAIIINETQFKSVRVLETDFKKCQEQLRNALHKLEQKTQESYQQQQQINQFRDVLEKVTSSYETLKQSTTEKQQTARSDESKLSQQIYVLQEELNLRDSQLNEIKSVNGKIIQEVEYFRQISIQQKERYQMLEKDLELYRGLLIQHNIIK